MATINTASDNSSYTVPLLISGLEQQTPTQIPLLNPTTSKPLWSYSSASVSEAQSAATSAASAFPAWRALNPTRRRDILLDACAVMQRRRDEFAGYIQAEVGAAPEFAVGSLVAAERVLKDIAGRLSGLGAEAPSCADDGQSAIVYREPYGVVLAILPWNSPFSTAIQSALSALAVGNTVVLKASELSPRSFWAIGSMLLEAGLPPGCLNVIQCQTSDAAAVTTALIEHPAIKKITFTGSANVGSIIAAQCGKALKPCVMELGGKATAIVLEDADIQTAAVQCALGSFIHAGQICMSTTRIVVHTSLAPAFAQALTATTTGIFGSAPPQCLITPAGAEKTRTLVRDALSQGARLIYGSLDSDANADTQQTQLKPMILEGVTPAMRIYGEESFGPEVAFFAVGSEEEAVRIANDTEYGLAAAVFTRDLARGLRVARGIEAGTVCINSMTMHDEANLPRGGVKKSGFGRVNGREGLLEFLWSKTVTWQNE